MNERCPKCNTAMVYDPPRFEGDMGSAKCLICCFRIWEGPKVAVEEIPQKGAR